MVSITRCLQSHYPPSSTCFCDDAGTAASLKLSYLAMTADLRAALSVSTAMRQKAAAISTSPAPAGSGIMMMNTVGNARLDQLRWYDGTFSEGSAVNGVGILGAASPAILWTYNEGECCSSPEQAALFFQVHLECMYCMRRRVSSVYR
jgi:hypothetical protein